MLNGSSPDFPSASHLLEFFISLMVEIPQCIRYIRHHSHRIALLQCCFGSTHGRSGHWVCRPLEKCLKNTEPEVLSKIPFAIQRYMQRNCCSPQGNGSGCISCPCKLLRCDAEMLFLLGKTLPFPGTWGTVQLPLTSVTVLLLSEGVRSGPPCLAELHYGISACAL